MGGALSSSHLKCWMMNRLTNEIIHWRNMRWLKGSAAYLPKRLKLNSQVHWKDGKFSFRSNVKFLLREWTHLKMQNGSHWHCTAYFRILQLARNVLELAIPDMDGYQTNSFLEMKVEQLVWVTSHMFWFSSHMSSIEKMRTSMYSINF